MRSPAVRSKQEIRDIVKSKRVELASEWLAAASVAAQDRVLGLAEFGAAGVVGCYMAMTAEVGTGALVEHCYRAGKSVCVPAMDPGTRTYRLAAMPEGAVMVAGCMGIPEPAVKEWVPVAEVGCIVVPGLGFDARGGRVGYGGGNYDRILDPVRGSRECFKVGLAFDFQVFELVPKDGNDVVMDAIVTEDRLIRVVK